MNLNATLTLLFILLITNAICAQSNSPDCYDSTNVKKHLSLGSKNFGIGLGSFKKYNGLNLNINNRTRKLNGASITAQSDYKSSINGFNLALASWGPIINGLNVNFIMTDDSIANGLNFGLFAAVTKRVNGLNFSSFIGKSDKAKGVCISSAEINENITGLSVGALINISKESRGLIISGVSCFSKKIKGAQIAPICIIKEEGIGIQVGVFNKATNIKGVQIGLINIIKENRKLFRILPLLNFHLKRKQKT